MGEVIGGGGGSVGRGSYGRRGEDGDEISSEGGERDYFDGCGRLVVCEW